MRVMLFLIFMLSMPAYAAVTNAYSGKVAFIHAEGNVGFIGLNTVIPGAEVTCPQQRVWVDLVGDVGRVKYSTGLAALSTGKEVSIRANPGASKVFGACALYDISIYQ